MEPIIRSMEQRDTDTVIDMMRVFYASDAVWSNGSEEIFRRNVQNCIGDFPFLQGYVFEQEGNLLGYAMLAKSYATEFGRPCIWIEDLYIREAYRGQGLGKRFFVFLEEGFTDVIFRLEVEPENQQAVGLYRRAGFDYLPYQEMKKLH